GLPRVVACPVLVRSDFFFFQAEDGIRDFHVTGVQTCALPISIPADALADRVVEYSVYPEGVTTEDAKKRTLNAIKLVTSTSADRSEERRVGKECRSRRSEDRDKKKEGQVGVPKARGGGANTDE